MADFSDNPEGFATLSRLLSRWPRERFRDPRRALELALRATKLESRRADYWVDLGMAQYRAGNDHAAIQALEKARGLPGDAAADAPENWLLLAMAHWRLGDRGQARQWYDKANGYLKDHPLELARQRRILAEASELLGVREPGSVTQQK